MRLMKKQKAMVYLIYLEYKLIFKNSCRIFKTIVNDNS